MNGLRHWFSIVSAIAHECLKWRDDLIKQIGYGSEVANLWCREFARQNLVVLVHRQMVSLR